MSIRVLVYTDNVDEWVDRIKRKVVIDHISKDFDAVVWYNIKKPNKENASILLSQNPDGEDLIWFEIRSTWKHIRGRRYSHVIFDKPTSRIDEYEIMRLVTQPFTWTDKYKRLGVESSDEE